jgi:uncharacterized protein
MSNTPHELADEFPADVARIHELKLQDTHFARLVEEYHEVNRAVHRAETRVDAITEQAETALRHQRFKLKDQIARALAG